MAAALSDEDVSKYADEGYLVVDGVLPLDEVHELRAVLESGGEGGSSLYGINMTTHHPAFLRLARDPRITDIIARLLGENICLQHSKTVHKATGGAESPGGGKVRFHQDFAYFPHTNTDVLAAMLVLDDFTEENACMRIVRGSHKLGLLDHNTTDDGFFNAEPYERELWEDDASLAKLMPRAGGLSIHHALTLHGSPESTSDRPRRGAHTQLVCSASSVERWRKNLHCQCGNPARTLTDRRAWLALLGR